VSGVSPDDTDELGSDEHPSTAAQSTTAVVTRSRTRLLNGSPAIDTVASGMTISG
jgi:hypothetical protein